MTPHLHLFPAHAVGGDRDASRVPGPTGSQQPHPDGVTTVLAGEVAKIQI
jgi:hypothetical protein